MYTFEELSDMHFCYVAADGNNTEARSLYTEKYSNRTIPSTMIFCKIDQRLRNTGTLNPVKYIQENLRRKNLRKWMSRKIERITIFYQLNARAFK